jgi:hypothetical protein
MSHDAAGSNGPGLTAGDFEVMKDAQGPVIPFGPRRQGRPALVITRLPIIGHQNLHRPRRRYRRFRAMFTILAN